MSSDLIRMIKIMEKTAKFAIRVINETSVNGSEISHYTITKKPPQKPETQTKIVVSDPKAMVRLEPSWDNHQVKPMTSNKLPKHSFFLTLQIRTVILV